MEVKKNKKHVSTTKSQPHKQGSTADQGVEGTGSICRNTEGLRETFDDEMAYDLYHAEKHQERKIPDISAAEEVERSSSPACILQTRLQVTR